MNHWMSKIFLALVCYASTLNLQAASINILIIEGGLGPGIVGSYSLNSMFSWIEHRYPGSTSGHSWTLAPGTDGGILLGQSQPNQAEITANRPMYNTPSWLYSVGNGISINEDESLDFQNLRLFWGEMILNPGTAPGYNTTIPRLTDASQLSATSNGWVLETDETYNLIFHTAGLCEGCELTIHLYGTALPVPLPSAFWLFTSSLAGLLGIAHRRKPKIHHE